MPFILYLNNCVKHITHISAIFTIIVSALDISSYIACTSCHILMTDAKIKIVLSLCMLNVYLTINWGLYVCMCVCLSVRLYVSTGLNGSSPNLEGTFYGS
jgi:hypothetical protein